MVQSRSEVKRRIIVRVLRRPGALLDGDFEPSRLVVPGSDAEKYFENGLANKSPRWLLDDLFALSRPIPRMAVVKTRRISEGTSYAVVQGEDSETEEDVTYGFKAEAMGANRMDIARLVGDVATGLAVASFEKDGNFEYFAPTGDSTSFTYAQIEELRQMIAIAYDASEEALT